MADILKKGDEGWEERRQALRDELTQSFHMNKLGVENGWLVEYIDQCTCAGGGAEVSGKHERHCGIEPIMDLVDDTTEFSTESSG